jgi:hypothetical protein
MEVYERFAHDAAVRMYLGLAVGVVAVVAAGMAVGVFSASANISAVKIGGRCEEVNDIGAMRLVDGRPQLCRP